MPHTTGAAGLKGRRRALVFCPERIYRPFGISRETVRSPAISVNIWFRLEVGRPAGHPVLVLLTSEKNVCETFEAIPAIVLQGVMAGESVVQPDVPAPYATVYTVIGGVELAAATPAAIAW